MKRVIGQLVLTGLLVGGAYLGWHYLLGNDPASEQAGNAWGAGQAVTVEAGEAFTARVQERLEAVGTARARESIEIVAESSGRVRAIHFEDGQRVTTGQVLVELDDSREQAELREAIALRDDFSKRLQRSRTMLASNTISQAQVDELEASLEAAEARVALMQIRIRDRIILAPFEGVVGLNEISPGAYVEPQRRITTLDDTAVIQLAFSIPERFLSRLEPGMTVQAGSAAYPEQPFVGRLSQLDSRVDPVTRSLRVQAEFDNQDGKLRPGMFMNVELILAERDAVLVAEQAVVSQGERHYVFMINGEQVEQRDVELGQRRRGEVEIRSGLEVGDRIVTGGVHRVRDGATVRIVETLAATTSG